MCSSQNEQVIWYRQNQCLKNYLEGYIPLIILEWTSFVFSAISNLKNFALNFLA